MIRKLFCLAMLGFVGCAMIAPLSGCDSGETGSGKATIDTSTPIKKPDAPASKKVEPFKPK